MIATINLHTLSTLPPPPLPDTTTNTPQTRVRVHRIHVERNTTTQHKGVPEEPEQKNLPTIPRPHSWQHNPCFDVPAPYQDKDANCPPVAPHRQHPVKLWLSIMVSMQPETFMKLCLALSPRCGTIMIQWNKCGRKRILTQCFTVHLHL